MSKNTESSPPPRRMALFRDTDSDRSDDETSRKDGETKQKDANKIVSWVRHVRKETYYEALKELVPQSLPSPTDVALREADAKYGTKEQKNKKPPYVFSQSQSDRLVEEMDRLVEKAERIESQQIEERKKPPPKDEPSLDRLVEPMDEPFECMEEAELNKKPNASSQKRKAETKPTFSANKKKSKNLSAQTTQDNAINDSREETMPQTESRLDGKLKALEHTVADLQEQLQKQKELFETRLNRRIQAQYYERVETNSKLQYLESTVTDLQEQLQKQKEMFETRLENQSRDLALVTSGDTATNEQEDLCPFCFQSPCDQREDIDDTKQNLTMYFSTRVYNRPNDIPGNTQRRKVFKTIYNDIVVAKGRTIYAKHMPDCVKAASLDMFPISCNVID